MIQVWSATYDPERNVITIAPEALDLSVAPRALREEVHRKWANQGARRYLRRVSRLLLCKQAAKVACRGKE
jgi:hypothetical protein